MREHPKQIRTKSIVLMTFLFLFACKEQTIFVRIAPPDGGDGVTVRAAVAASELRRERGLKYVRRLADDQGMLFVFDPPESGVSFWMKDVRIALDIIFCDAAGKIVHLVRNAPPGTTRHFGPETAGSNEPIRYALEIRAGFIDRKNIRMGDRIELKTKK